MRAVHICKCNNCDHYLYDENPQVDAVEKDIKDFEMIYPMELLNEDGESFWGCGECQTDGYLMDL